MFVTPPPGLAVSTTEFYRIKATVSGSEQWFSSCFFLNGEVLTCLGLSKLLFDLKLLHEML